MLPWDSTREAIEDLAVTVIAAVIVSNLVVGCMQGILWLVGAVM